jgi:hypothetical protein
MWTSRELARNKTDLSMHITLLVHCGYLGQQITGDAVYRYLLARTCQLVCSSQNCFVLYSVLSGNSQAPLYLPAPVVIDRGEQNERAVCAETSGTFPDNNIGA